MMRRLLIFTLILVCAISCVADTPNDAIIGDQTVTPSYEIFKYKTLNKLANDIVDWCGSDEADPQFCNMLSTADWKDWFNLGVCHLETNPDAAHAAFILAYASLSTSGDEEAFLQFCSPLLALVALEGEYEDLSLAEISDSENPNFESIENHPEYTDLVEFGAAALTSCSAFHVLDSIQEMEGGAKALEIAEFDDASDGCGDGIVTLTPTPASETGNVGTGAGTGWWPW